MKNSILGGVLLGVIAVAGYGAESGVFAYKVGQIDVYVMVENQGPGRPSVLIGDKQGFTRYLPADFQSETNTFLIRNGKDIIVVDTGFGGAIFEHLAALGVKPADVTAVLLTHLHGDHIGGLQKEGKPLFPNAQVYLSKRELASGSSDGGKTLPAPLAPYGDRIVAIEPGTLDAPLSLASGVGAAASYGHTPGHTVIVVENNGAKLLIWGDLMHVELVQFPLPDTAVTYDRDPAAATISRKQALAWAMRNKAPIAGSHLVYPALGTVEQYGAGYKFVSAN